MDLIFLHGPAAVGKLTVARALAHMTGLRLFHNHLTVDALTAVFDFGTEPFILLREQLWLTIFREAAKRQALLNSNNTLFSSKAAGLADLYLYAGTNGEPILHSGHH